MLLEKKVWYVNTCPPDLGPKRRTVAESTDWDELERMVAVWQKMFGHCTAWPADVPTPDWKGKDPEEGPIFSPEIGC